MKRARGVLPNKSELLARSREECLGVGSDPAALEALVQATRRRYEEHPSEANRLRYLRAMSARCRAPSSKGSLGAGLVVRALGGRRLNWGQRRGILGVMNRLLRLALTSLAVVLVVICLGACDMSGRQVQAHTANAISQGANSALPILIERYRSQGLKVIEEASTREGAEAQLAAVRQRWAPVWASWEACRLAHGSWAEALEAGGDTVAALGAMKRAYCELHRVWPKTIPALPLGALGCAAGAKP